LDKLLYSISYIQSHTPSSYPRLPSGPFFHITTTQFHTHSLYPSAPTDPFFHIIITQFHTPSLYSPAPTRSFSSCQKIETTTFSHPTHLIIIYTSTIYDIQASAQSIIYLHIHQHICIHTSISIQNIKVSLFTSLHNRDLVYYVRHYN